MSRTLAVAFLVAALIPAQAQALENEDLLALVAMPLAVAAVSEMTGVPMNELVDVVTLMNDAAVPPPQFIEVVRYAPVALVVEDDQPEFVDFVRVQFDQGLRGPALVSVIEERIHLLGFENANLDVVAPRVVDIDEDFIPVVVRTRVAEVKAHPHGGPPGQLKKQLGLKTGAEVVHGSKPGRSRVTTRVIDDDDRKPKKVHVGKGDSKGHGGDHGKGKGKGKGKG